MNIDERGYLPDAREKLPQYDQWDLWDETAEPQGENNFNPEEIEHLAFSSGDTYLKSLSRDALVAEYLRCMGPRVMEYEKAQTYSKEIKARAGDYEMERILQWATKNKLI